MSTLEEAREDVELSKVNITSIIILGEKFELEFLKKAFISSGDYMPRSAFYLLNREDISGITQVEYKKKSDIQTVTQIIRYVRYLDDLVRKNPGRILTRRQTETIWMDLILSKFADWIPVKKLREVGTGSKGFDEVRKHKQTILRDAILQVCVNYFVCCFLY